MPPPPSWDSPSFTAKQSSLLATNLISSAEFRSNHYNQSKRRGGAAFQAGVKPQDIIVTINGSQIPNLKPFYEKVWKSGEAGVTIELGVFRRGTFMNLKVKTVDRLDYFFKPQSF